MIPSNHQRIPDAIYGDPLLEEYQQNPFISCLPPLYSNEQLVELLRIKPHFDPQERQLDGRVRMHAMCRLLHSFFKPLNHHLELEQKISLMIRTGYIGRSPETGDFNAHLQNGYQRIMKGDLNAQAFPDVHSTATSLSLFGCSGCGKSRAIERMLSMYPQAINHPKYNIVQLTYLKIDCPSDGDLNALCLSFFRAVDHVLGTRYSASHGRKKLGEVGLLANMCQIANLHSLGLLIIDEIQNLSEAKSGGAEKMHNFFVMLANTIGVPIIQIGTHKARKFFERTFRAARRATGFGSLLWDRLPRDKQWKGLLKTLWKYQWLRDPQPLDDQLETTMYDLTQGVMDIVVKLFVLSQARAIATETEKLTPALIRKVYEDELKPVHPMLAALRTGRADVIQRYDDLLMPEIEAQLLALAVDIEAITPDSDRDEAPVVPVNDKTKKLISIMEQMDIPMDIRLPMAEQLLSNHPELPIPALIHKLTQYTVQAKPEAQPKPNRVKQAQWSTLPHHDVRQTFASADSADKYEEFKKRGLIFDLQALLKAAS